MAIASISLTPDAIQDGHLILDVSDDTTTHCIVMQADDIDAMDYNVDSSYEGLVKARIRSFAKENGHAFADLKTVIGGQSFQV